MTNAHLSLSGLLRNKYKYTAYFYDFLDYPWERLYRQWRPKLLFDLRGKVIEAGVGTGRNLQYYPSDIDLTAIDLSPQMLSIAASRAKKANCNVSLLNIDASLMTDIEDSSFDCLISTFLCCVMPDALQKLAIEQFVRVLKPGAIFRIIEMVYSQDENKKQFQKRIAPIVEFIYGARFDRKTLLYLTEHPNIEITKHQFLKDDTYLLIEGLITKDGV